MAFIHPDRRCFRFAPVDVFLAKQLEAWSQPSDERRGNGGNAVLAIVAFVSLVLVSGGVTSAVWLGATACQVGFKDSDTVLGSPGAAPSVSQRERESSRQTETIRKSH